MSKSNAAETSFLSLVYNATPWANIADNAASAPITQVFVSLHTGDPGEAGTQATNEAAYTGYARLGVNRNAGGWTVSGNQVTNTGTAAFAPCTGGTASVTHFATGVASTGATTIIHKGALGPLTGLFGYTVTTDDTLTVPGSSFAVDDRVSVAAFEGAQQTPGAGLVVGTVYFVRSATGENITLSLTSGGATVDVTGTGSGILQRHQVLVVSAGITPTFNAGQIQITEG
jgi:hypothetical protein